MRRLLLLALLALPCSAADRSARVPSAPAPIRLSVPAATQLAAPSLSPSAVRAVPTAALPALPAPAAAAAAAPAQAPAVQSAAPVQAQTSEAAQPAAATEAAAADASKSFDQSGAPKPLRLVIMGPPASGKGTYAQRLARDYSVIHISAGDLLRAHAKDNPEIAAIMQRGDLVPTPLVVGLVKERLKKDDVQARGFLLDGFPRRLAEAKELKAMLKAEGIKLDAAIKLDAPEEVLLRRILARGRPDDTEPTFRNRMKVYREETVPAMRHISRGTTVLRPRLSGDDADANYAEVKRLLDRLGEPGAVKKAWTSLLARLRALLG